MEASNSKETEIELSTGTHESVVIMHSCPELTASQASRRIEGLPLLEWSRTKRGATKYINLTKVYVMSINWGNFSIFEG